jgi:branched-chain amino acid transport system substrate-binding protein
LISKHADSYFREMKRMRGISVLAVALLSVGCRSEPEVATIGVAYDAVRLPDVQVAMEEIAEWPEGGIEISFLLDTIEVAGGGFAEIEAARATRLVGERVNGEPLAGIVGPGSSRGALAAAPIYNEAGMVNLVPNATSRLLEAVGEWTFLLAPNDSIMGDFMGGFIANTLAASRVTVFYISTEYGFGLRDGVSTSLKGRGVEVVDEIPYDAESDFDVLVSASLARGVPDVVVLAARFREAMEIIQRVQGEHPEIAYVGGDGINRSGELPSGGRNLERLYFADFWHKSVADSASQAFVDRFTRIAGRAPAADNAITHDALMLLATAVREVGTRPSAIRAFLEDTERSRTLYEEISGEAAYRGGPVRKLYMVRALDGGLALIGGGLK